MIPASEAIQRPPDARLRIIEVRLAGRHSVAPNDVHEFCAIVFGAGDFRTRTEDRAAPPHLSPGDQLLLGPLKANVNRLLGHPRLVSLCFQDPPDGVWAGIAHHGRPIQYSHVQAPLAMWDVWTPIAGPPVAFEPPSAGFALDWRSLALMRARGVRFTTLTHAAGISSTGDPQLDNLLPLDEPFSISAMTAAAVNAARTHGGRVIAIGTTVVRALEAAGVDNGKVRGGSGVATGRIGAGTKLQIVDAILTGAHEPGTSHHVLLGAFLDETRLRRIDAELAANHYRTHEFGDSLLIERVAGSMAAGRKTRTDMSSL